MAPKKVIADSDDEDDEPMSPTEWRVAAPTPEPEPLSPGLDQPNEAMLNNHGRAHASDTDSSFFAHVYDDQQGEALQQSLLIESIVRQTQKASASNNDMSLPRPQSMAKAMTTSSSENNATSPMVIEIPSNHQSKLSEGATRCTPLKSPLQDMWDVPSSPDLVSPKMKGSSRRRVNRNISRAGPVTTDSSEVPTAAITQNANGEGSFGPSPRAAKRQKIQSHGPETEDPSTFYIEQSNLTTMQKLEYHKITTSSSYPVPTIPSTNKSSGGATILYSTPSRYASSGPRPAWESTPAMGRPRAQHNDIIHIRSSPDEIATCDEWTAKPDLSAAVKPGRYSANEAADAQNGMFVKRPGKTNENTTARAGDSVDELGPDDLLIGRGDDVLLEHIKPLPDTAPFDSTSAISPSCDTKDVQEPQAYQELPAIPVECSEAATIQDTTKNPPSIPDTQLPDSPENSPVVPKKRGRKKKHQNDEKDRTVPATRVADKEMPPTVGVESENKQKKKRGRPRKSESTAKDVTSTHPSQDPKSLPDENVAPSLCLEDKQTEGDNVDDQDLGESPPKKKNHKKQKSKAEKEVGVLAQYDNDDDNENDLEDPVAVPAKTEPKTGKGQDRTPLRKLDKNAHCPLSNEKAVSGDEEETAASEENEQRKKPKRSGTDAENGIGESAGGLTSESSATPQNKPAATPAHATKAATATTPASQPSKALYRVGLSKRSRIAPLLKSIKK